jgi:predicted dehydrogenase
MSDPLRVGLIGCGVVGRKRAAALGDDQLVGGFDVVEASAASLAGDFGGAAASSLDDLLRQECDVIVVATPHDQLAENACRALDSGAHVLVEKPGGVGLADVERIQATADRTDRRVKVGFNHRFHPGTRRAVEDALSGDYGDVLFFRARYGHGGRLGYEDEWRANKRVSGGGELVDQGMHLLDLSHWLLGPLPLHSALLRTQYWTTEVEDNAVIVLGADERRSDPWCAFHVSWTEWKNTFALEIYCRTAKLEVTGLAGSYGPQRLTLYRMKPELGPPDVEVFDYKVEDTSWESEWAHLAASLREGGTLLGDLASLRYGWEIVEAAYARTQYGTLLSSDAR